MALLDEEYENWTICRQMFPHACMILLCQPNNQEYVERWASILCKAASYSTGKGRQELAEEMNRRALTGRKKVLGKEHLNTLASVNHLAAVLRHQGKYEQAEETNRRALTMRECARKEAS